MGGGGGAPCCAPPPEWNPHPRTVRADICPWGLGIPPAPPACPHPRDCSGQSPPPSCHGPPGAQAAPPGDRERGPSCSTPQRGEAPPPLFGLLALMAPWGAGALGPAWGGKAPSSPPSSSSSFPLSLSAARAGGEAPGGPIRSPLTALQAREGSFAPEGGVMGVSPQSVCPLEPPPRRGFLVDFVTSAISYRMSNSVWRLRGRGGEVCGAGGGGAGCDTITPWDLSPPRPPQRGFSHPCPSTPP